VTDTINTMTLDQLRAAQAAVVKQLGAIAGLAGNGVEARYAVLGTRIATLAGITPVRAKYRR